MSGAWWPHRGSKTSPDVLTLGQSTIGGAVQAGIVATSIFIPLSLAAIQVMIGPSGTLASGTLRGPISHLIVAVFWFGVSTIWGVTGLVYIGQRIGESRDVLRDRLIGITLNLQYWSLVVGVLRVLYALVLLWLVAGLGFG